MGKRDKRVAFMNPIAAARARGPAPTSGPTIRDYLSRNRISLEEAEEMIIKNSKRGGSDTLSAWEEELNDKYKKELKKAREKKLAAVAAPSFKKKKKKKKKSKKQAKARSRSQSPSLLGSDDDDTGRKKRKRRKEKRKKRRKRHQSSSESDSSDESEDESGEEVTRKRKTKSATTTTDLPAGRGAGKEQAGSKALLPTPAVEPEEPQRNEQKATKWTNKWDVKDPLC